LCLAVCAVMIGIVVRAENTRESLRLPKHVLSRIPRSASVAEVDSQQFHFGHRFVLWLRIRNTDVAGIVSSGPFRKFDWVSFCSGDLFWGDRDEPPSGDPRENPFFGRNVANVALYRGERLPPEWFNVNGWNDPNVYVCVEKWGRSRRYHKQILIYSESVGEAYFVDHLEGK
jgi:hypothetical protein